MKAGESGLQERVLDSELGNMGRGSQDPELGNMGRGSQDPVLDSESDSRDRGSQARVPDLELDNKDMDSQVPAMALVSGSVLGSALESGSAMESDRWVKEYRRG